MNEYEKKSYRFSSLSSVAKAKKEDIVERDNQIKKFEKELSGYKIFLSDLATMTIDEKIKNELLNISFFIVNNIKLLEKFRRKKEIPIDIICKEYIKPKTVIKHWRDYIVAYVILLSRPEYKTIQDYIKVIEVHDLEEETKAIIEINKNAIGIILSKNIFTTIILTPTGEFKKVKPEKNTSVGEEVEGKVKKKLSEQRDKIIGVVLTIILISVVVLYNYINVKSTVLVKTTSSIVLEINSFNRVININSETEKGKMLIDSIDTIDRNIDFAILEVVKYANENAMIPTTGIAITVNGDKIKYGYLEKTENYLFLEGIDVKLNNSGIEQDLK